MTVLSGTASEVDDAEWSLCCTVKWDFGEWRKNFLDGEALSSYSNAL